MRYFGHNFTFERQPNGDVAVKYEYDDESVVETLTQNQWASVMAAMSRKGETEETLKAAEAFHSDAQVAQR